MNTAASHRGPCSCRICPTGRGRNHDQDVSRRDVLNSATALAATVFACRCARLRRKHRRSRRRWSGREKGRQARLLHRHGSRGCRAARQGVRGEVSRHPVRVERSGAERVFQRIGQEYGGNIHAVDIVNTADPAHCIVWKRNGWLAPYLPEEVASITPHYYDPDGLRVTTRVLLSPLGYNTNLVKPEDAPRASPTCSIRNGRARSSRRIPPIAAPS